MKLRTPLDFALAYTDRNWPVFPCRGKRPLTDNGFHAATTEAHQLHVWWKRWHDANVAIATGSASGGLVVLDIDPRPGGVASLEKIQADYGALPTTATVRTGGGGGHGYLRASQPVRSRCPLPGYPGLDLKAEGGYVIAPPSVHASGKRYAWHRRDRIAEAPAWLVELANHEEPKPTFDPPAVQRSMSDLDGVLRGYPRVRARFERHPSGLHDTTPSGVDLGLASGLALLGFDEDSIAYAIVESRSRAGLPGKRPSYLRSTVRKALGVRA
jgi:hypothetical protein